MLRKAAGGGETLGILWAQAGTSRHLPSRKLEALPLGRLSDCLLWLKGWGRLVSPAGWGGQAESTRAGTASFMPSTA